MLSRSLAQLLGKGNTRPPDLVIQASTALRRFSHLLQRPQNCLPADGQHPLQKFSRVAPPLLIFEPSWTVQHNFSTLENPADSCLDSIRATVGGSLAQRSATLRSIGECADVYGLRLLLRKKAAPICYVWCDPSPWMHMSQGISMATNVHKMVKAGCKVKILMADWFARMHPKIAGDLSKMQTICLYNIELLKATGMDLDAVEIVWLSDEIRHDANKYWPFVMDVANTTELNELERCLSFDSPDGTRDFTPAQTLHLCLQCACMLSLQEVDIWLLGIEQRGAIMLAGEYCKFMRLKNIPTVLFHNVVPSLLQHTEWVEWGDPRWAIFMEDDEGNVIRKVKKAFCPPKLAEGNPCLEYIKDIILPRLGKFEVVQKGENGGNKMFLRIEELTADYSSGALHPADMKQALAKAINIILQPVRDHFSSCCEAKKLAKAMEEYYIIDRAKGPNLCRRDHRIHVSSPSIGDPC